MKQRQFLDVASVEEARTRWLAGLELRPGPPEALPLDAALGRILAEDVRAPGDVPAFDRANVDGYAVRAADTFGASEGEPATLHRLDGSVAAGHAPAGEVTPGHALAVATGGPVPRGADAMVMIEDTRPGPDDTCIEVTRPVTPGSMVSPAGSDLARRDLVLRAGTRLTARETGTLAACGIASVRCTPRVRVAVISTGDEITAPGTPLALGQVHDANATLLTHAVRELGAEADSLGIAPDDAASIRALLARVRDGYDLTLLSGGTSKGEGDLSYRVLAETAEIVVHGVALKPGKPLCLARWGTTPVAVLPGFPTSAIFTFHKMVAPVLRAMLGQTAHAGGQVRARLAQHVASDRGRAEFTLVDLVARDDGLRAFPLGKGSGSVTTFARADGFFEIPADAAYAEVGDELEITLLGQGVQPAALTIIGSDCLGLEPIVRHVQAHHGAVKVVPVGSQGGVRALTEGSADIAPLHLLDPGGTSWNETAGPEGTRLLRGYGRVQGLAFRPADAATFESADIEEALRAAAANPGLRLAHRNRGSGTRLIVDAVLGDQRPEGWTSAYRSHAAVAAAIAQGRADWGVCLQGAAEAAGLAFRPWRTEQYDFLVRTEAFDRPALRAFRRALADPAVRAEIEARGFRL